MYTDGACRGNPGPGGWGVLLRAGKRERELSGGEADTTNNRMELTAAIEGLKALQTPLQGGALYGFALCHGRHYRMDGQLEETWLENRGTQTGQERRSVAGAGSRVPAVMTSNGTGCAAIPGTMATSGPTRWPIGESMTCLPVMGDGKPEVGDQI